MSYEIVELYQGVKSCMNVSIEVVLKKKQKRVL